MVSVMFLKVGTTPRIHSRILPSGRGFLLPLKKNACGAPWWGRSLNKLQLACRSFFVEAQCNFSNDPARVTAD
jgi:hypothetical protein